MNQKGYVVPVVIIVVVVAVAGAAWYFMARGNDATEAPGIETEQTAAEQEQVSGKLSDLFLLGRSVTCTFSNEGNSGVVYVEGGQERMRGDFTTQTAAGTTVGHIINDGEYTYTWSDAESQGVRFASQDIDTPAAGVDETGTSATGDVLDSNYEYDCDSWRVDESKFTVPPDKEFIDIGGQFQQIQEQVPQGNAEIDCSVCNQAEEGPARQQCLQALNCL